MRLKKPENIFQDLSIKKSLFSEAFLFFEYYNNNLDNSF